MKISSIVKHSRTLITSLVALLILAVLGSSWAVLRADVPRVASGTWAAAGEVVIPSGAVSVALADGRVVVAGGKSDGVLSPVISTYDPASGAWARVGDLVTARSGHAISVLNDGRVLIAGGTASDGPTFDIEIYDPANGTSVHAGDMTLARVDHAVATLKDGRVLIVGGSDGVSALNLAEIFDPATGQSVGVPNVMSTARVRATATAMIDGHVLVVGGNDGANDLASAEIFEPATGSFFGTGAMQVARSGHVAVLLPNNNQVLIAGGMSAGAAVASAELYADWRDGFSSTTPMSAARLGAIAGGLQPHDVAFVAGGGANTGDYYGYATVKTDKDDYAPYETVTISGSGWQPGETVHLRVSEDADTHSDWELEAIADEFGNIVNYDFYPRQDDIYQHIGMRFYLTATGVASQALATFTDAGSIALNPSSGQVGTSVTVTSGGGEFAKNSNVGIYWDDDLVTPLTTCSTNNGGNFPDGTCTFSVPPSGAGAHTVTAKQGSVSFSATFTVVAASGEGTMVVNPTTVTGGSTGNNFTFTFTAPASSYVAGSQATITIPSGWTAPTTANTALAGSTCTALSRTVSSSTITVNMTCAAGQSFTLTYNGITAPGAAGPYTFTTRTKQGAGGTLTNIASSPVVTVTPACTPTSVTTQPSNQSVTYGSDATFTAAASGDPAATVQWQASTDGVNFTNLSAQTSTTLTLTKPAVSQSGNKYRAVFTNTCGGTQTATSAAAALTVAAKSVTGSFTAANKSYDGTTTATITGRSLSGAVSGDDLSLNGGSATFSDKQVADGKTVTGTGFVLAGSAAGNYSLASSTLTTTADIKALAVTITANAKSKTYGDDNPALDAVAAGAVNGDTLDYSLATTAVKFSAVGSYPIEVTLGTNPNYTVTKVDAALTINPAVATVTANAKSKTYGDDNPALDAVVVGNVNGDTLDYSLATTAVKFSAVGSYPITVTLGTNPNYTVTKVDAALKVDAREAKVEANAKSKTYGDDNPALDAVVAGAVNGDTLNYSLATTAVKTSGIGSYPITVTLGSNPNYTVTKVDAALTVNPALATVTANAKSKTYGDDNPALDAVVVGAVNDDTLAYSLATTAVKTSGVGSYPIEVTLGTNPNYTVTKVDAALTVNPALATVTANAKSKTYGDDNPTLDATVTGTVNGENLAYSLATTALKFSGVGSYPIEVTLGTNPNYTVTKVDAALTVNPAVATVTANAKSKTYGDDNPALDAVVVGAVNGDTLAYSLATTALKFSGVGSYPIEVTLGPNPNYAITVVNGNLTIGKRTLTVTPDGGKTKILGEVFTAFTGSVFGLQGSDAGTATYASLGAPAAALVGSYDITSTFAFTSGVQSNYDVQLNTAVKGLVVLYRWDGFLQPINDTAHDLVLMSKFKAGQTIPAKFVLKNAAGAVVQQAGIPTFTRTDRLGACDSAAALENPELVSADVVPQYKWDGAQYHYNWSTKGLPTGLYRIFANLGDGTARSVDICLTK